MGLSDYQEIALAQAISMSIVRYLVQGEKESRLPREWTVGETPSLKLLVHD